MFVCFFLSIYICVCLPGCLLVSLYICRSSCLCLYVCLLFHVYMCLSVCWFLFMSVCFLCLYIYVCLLVSVYICLSACLCVSLSFCLYAYIKAITFSASVSLRRRLKVSYSNQEDEKQGRCILELKICQVTFCFTQYSVLFNLVRSKLVLVSLIQTHSVSFGHIQQYSVLVVLI